jgi:hypothetical protein
MVLSAQGFESRAGGPKFPRKHRWPVVVCETAVDEHVAPILFEHTKAIDKASPAAMRHEHKRSLYALCPLAAELILIQSAQSSGDLVGRSWREVGINALQ